MELFYKFAQHKKHSINFYTIRYFEKGAYVLKDVNFHIDAGSHVAIVGATGSGKSTIINLIPRFYDATSGKVVIDGNNVKYVLLESLRRSIGIVLQDTYLFTGPVRDNIAYGDPDATDEAVQKAAADADANEFIEVLPDGYNTVLGEKGVTLSGGQRQRISIARAILIHPKILILDDSTSYLDAFTERKVERAISDLSRNVTTFTIAQKIKTVINADTILVLEKGELRGIGTHRELIETNSLYADIVESQFSGLELKNMANEKK